MTQQGDARGAPRPALPGTAHGLVRWLCTKNPFYVISAGLFLAGLRISFGDPAKANDTYAMMGGLAGYTLLLAGAACLLVRFAKAWDDLRTVLLLVVLMFLATSVTFDEVLVLTPTRGVVCYLAGLAFAVAVSEGVLRGIRLRLPTEFRLPYYLILALFFLYPLVLRPLVDQPRSEALMWGLFGFTTVAGALLLTLLPAIRRGPGYVSVNGSPWPWPLYPWSLFVFLAAAVPARSFLLSWSMHLLGQEHGEQLIFGAYFLIPFGLAIAVLLLELGLTSKNKIVTGVALALPMMLIVLALVGHRAEPIYEGFLEIFRLRLGGLPAYVTALAVVAFYAVAAVRRVPWSTEMLTAGLGALALIGPSTLHWNDLVTPRPLPLFAIAALQLALGIGQRVSWRCLAGCIAAALGLVVSDGTALTPFRGAIAFHAALLTMLVIGGLFDDAFAKALRVLGVVGSTLAALAMMVGPFELRAGLPPWATWIYPLALGVVLAGYAALLRIRFALAGAGVILSCWLATSAWQGYLAIRLLIVGLDYLVLGLVFLAVAILTSLAKAGALPRWRSPAGIDAPTPSD